ncbi:DUF6325 family protein [Actinomycetospora sp. TBRC 11914]|uniref:DUF6325 family protein n=1 Tax=Actinomycetospora sp. TBRC 11914 TaxID=2729387 RepID=UPI00145C79AB|nr:DUF6325 family protein [Actinomycetospora sp. TBRC 11914]NMO92705.1 DUF1269 domain-containing protein [Actinomycetospora sp. TBRC 11914]
MDEDTVEVGPVDFLVIEFPAGGGTGEGLPLLLDLVDRRIVRILDFIVVRRGQDGTVTVAEIADVDGDGVPDLRLFEGATSGLLGPDDADSVGSVLEPGAVGVAIVYENLWAAPLATALRRGGARLVAGGRVSVEDLVAAAEAVETPA